MNERLTGASLVAALAIVAVVALADPLYQAVSHVSLKGEREFVAQGMLIYGLVALIGIAWGLARFFVPLFVQTSDETPSSLPTEQFVAAPAAALPDTPTSPAISAQSPSLPSAEPLVTEPPATAGAADDFAFLRRRGGRLTVLLVALAVAWLSAELLDPQTLLRDPLVMSAGLGGLVRALAETPITVLGRNVPRTPLFVGALALLVAGLLLPPAAEASAIADAPAPDAGRPLFRTSNEALVVGAAGGWFLELLLRLWNGTYVWYDGWIALVIVVVLLALFVRLDRDRGVTLRIRANRFDLAWVLAVGALFLALVIPTLSDWRFSVVGDEYAFFDHARDIAYGKLVANAFSQTGVYGYHPELVSIYQAGVMDLLGINGWVWKLSSVILIVASLPFVYGFARQAFGPLAAAAAVFMTALSHYILAYAHTGEDNIQPIFPSTVAVAAYWLALSRRSAFFAAVAGVACALGFYTFYTARFMVALLAIHLAWLFFRHRPLARSLLIPFASGFVVLFGPFAAANKLAVITAMLEQSTAQNKLPPLETLRAMATSTLDGFMVLFQNSGSNGLFVSGTYLDLITSVLCVTAAVAALRQLRRPALALTFFWFVGSVWVSSGTAQYGRATVTREQFIVVPATILAGFALDRVLAELTVPLPRIPRLALSGALAALVLAAVYQVNVQRVFVVTPATLGAQPAAVAVHALTVPECANRGLIAPTILDARRDQLIVHVIDAYDYGDRQPWLLSYPEVVPAGFMDHRSCVIFSAGLRDDAVRLAQSILQANPGTRRRDVTDLSGHNPVIVLYNPGATPLPPDSVLGRLSPKFPTIDWTAAGPGTDPGRLREPRGLARAADGALYVADSANQRLSAFGPTGRFTALLDAPRAGQATLERPVGVAILPSGNLVVADEARNVADLLAPSGTLIRQIAVGATPLNQPSGVAADAQGRIYIADRGNNRVVVASADNSATAQIRLPAPPLGVAILPNGFLAVSGLAQHALWIFDPAHSEQPVDQWRLEGQENVFGSRLAVLGDALVVTSPELGSLNVFDLSGHPIGFYARLQNHRFARPTGIVACGALQLCLTDAELDQLTGVSVAAR